MRDIELMEGLKILSKYRKPGYWLEAEHDEIWVGNTDVPITKDDFKTMCNLGFILDIYFIENGKLTYSDYLNDEYNQDWYCYT
jgi:hypothetical protein